MGSSAQRFAIGSTAASESVSDDPSVRTPNNYAEWIDLIERFRDGDDDALTAMARGSIEWTNVVAERWTKHLINALTVRIKAIQINLQRSLDRAAGDTFAISSALIDARRRLGPLRGLTTIECLDVRVRALLTDELNRWARETQESLEKGAKRPGSSDGRLLKAFRDNALTGSVEGSLPRPNAECGVSTSRHRRIIL